MYTCIHVCMYVCKYACMCIYIYIHAYTYMFLHEYYDHHYMYNIYIYMYCSAGGLHLAAVDPAQPQRGLAAPLVLADTCIHMSIYNIA